MLVRILITGCGGFVGRHLCERLLKRQKDDKELLLYAGVYDQKEADVVEDTIRSFDKAPVGSKVDAKFSIEILQADITKKEEVFRMVRTACPDRVVHLAAQASVALSFQKPALTMDVNVLGTGYLLEALREVNPKARILLVGSADQYGFVEESRQPILETEPLTAKSPYGESKMQQEQLALKCVGAYGQDILLVRSAPHIGRGQARTFAVADWTAQIKEMQQGSRSHALTVGNLEAVRDVTDVRDVAEAYLELLEKGKTGEIYNVGTGKGIKMSEIPPLLGKLAGISDLQVRIDPDRFRPADIPMLVIDNRKLRECTNWKPVYSLEETLRDMLENG